MDELRSKIKQARSDYWANTPSISDNEYDALLVELSLLDENDPLLVEVEGPINTGEKVIHPVRLLSLEKVFTTDLLLKWMKKVSRDVSEKFVITPKYDGLACRFYKDTHTLATRGENGIEGENITDKKALIRVILNSSEVLAVDELSSDIQGELLCTNAVYEKCTITRSNGEKYKTPRNLVAGITNTDDMNLFKNKDGSPMVILNFVDYKAYKYVRTLDQLTSSEFEKIVDEFNGLGFPTDGLVIRLEDEVYGDALGVTSHHPKHSIALKFPDDVETSTLIDIKFQTGKNKITPVAIVDPVVVDGVTVQRITLHNAKFCIDNDIQIGDTLQIVRAGRVIPKVVGSVPGDTRTSIVINSCPSCSGSIEYREPFLYCINPDCEGKVARRIEYSAKVLGLDIIGPGTIDKCIAEFGCRTIADIIRLDICDFHELPGFAELSATNAHRACRDIMNNPQPDYKIMASVGKTGLGQGVWKKVLVEHTIKELMQFDEFELSRIDTVGPERAEMIYESLHHDGYIGLLHDMFDLFDVISTKGCVSTKDTICFSGKFPHPKATYQQMAVSKGLDVVSTVSKGLKYLVTTGAMTSKVSKARSYGVHVISLDDFDKL